MLKNSFVYIQTSMGLRDIMAIALLCGVAYIVFSNSRLLSRKKENEADDDFIHWL